MKCPLCGAENAPSATKCYLCNYKLRAASPGPSEQFRRKSEFYPSGQSSLPRFKSQTPTYAGGLLLLVALADFLGILVSNVYVGYYLPELKDIMLISSVVVGTFATITTVGGFLTVFRRHWRVCLAVSIMTAVMHLLAGAVLRMMLSIVAFIFIILAKREFD